MRENMRRNMRIKTQGKNYQQNKIKKKQKEKRRQIRNIIENALTNQFQNNPQIWISLKKEKSSKTKSNWNACNVPVFTYTSNPTKIWSLNYAFNWSFGNEKPRKLNKYA